MDLVCHQNAICDGQKNERVEDYRSDNARASDGACSVLNTEACISKMARATSNGERDKDCTRNNGNPEKGEYPDDEYVLVEDRQHPVVKK